MKTIYSKFNGGNAKDVFHTPMGWLALGDHGVDPDETHLLSPSCASMGEIEEQAEYLKGLIDDAVKQARKKLP